MGCLVIDENILISISHYDKELNGMAIDSFNSLFDLIGFELCGYRCEASQFLSNLRFIEEDDEFEKVLGHVLKELANRQDIYMLFINDKDWKNDLLLIAYAYWRAKTKKDKCVLLTREKRIREACRLLGLECCCLLHVLECVVNEFKYEEFAELLGHLQNRTKLTHPKWAYGHSICCRAFES